jgi:hypothetical protein
MTLGTPRAGQRSNLEWEALGPRVGSQCECDLSQALLVFMETRGSFGMGVKFVPLPPRGQMAMSLGFFFFLVIIKAMSI